MRVSVFEQYGALNSAPVFSAIKQGFGALGIQTVSDDVNADIAVIWSMLQAGRMKPNQEIYQQFTSTGRPVVVAEVGMINRGHTWKLGLNGTGINSYPGSAVETRANTLGIKLQPWTESGTNIVICVQREDSYQWVGQPTINQWLNTTITTLRRHTSRPIVVRSHPRQRIQHPPDCIIQTPKLIKDSYDSFDFDSALRNAWAVINWNSGPGVQAVINGVPAFVGPTSLATPVANLDLTKIENPSRPDRSQWVDLIASTEWTLEELITGYPIKRLLSAIPGQTFI
jgi:hypothetical protein